MPVSTFMALDRGWDNLLNTTHEARFPNIHTTGWAPTGTTLTPFTGTYFITETTLIEDKLIDVEALYVATSGITVTIRRSQITGHIDCSSGGSLVLEDCNIDVGAWVGPAVGYRNLTIRRCSITGGQHSVMGTHNSLIEDSYLHDQFNDPTTVDGYHNNAFISNGGYNTTLRHNTLDCATVLTANGGGPTGAASLHGDFEPLNNYVFDGNYFAWSTGSYVLWLGWGPGKPYGTQVTNIVASDNVFERRPGSVYGAQYGTITSAHSATADPGYAAAYYPVVTNNRWEDNRQLVDVG